MVIDMGLALYVNVSLCPARLKTTQARIAR